MHAAIAALFDNCWTAYHRRASGGGVTSAAPVAFDAV
jgi:hypothetical protein